MENAHTCQTIGWVKQARNSVDAADPIGERRAKDKLRCLVSVELPTDFLGLQNSVSDPNLCMTLNSDDKISVTYNVILVFNPKNVMHLMLLALHGRWSSGLDIVQSQEYLSQPKLDKCH